MKLICSYIVFLIFCLSLIRFAWCEEIQKYPQSSGENFDRAHYNLVTDTLAIKNPIGKSLAVVEKGRFKPAFVNQNEVPKNHVKFLNKHGYLTSQNLLSSLATVERLQQINTGILAPGGFTPTAAFDKVPQDSES